MTSHESTVIARGYVKAMAGSMCFFLRTNRTGSTIFFRERRADKSWSSILQLFNQKIRRKSLHPPTFSSDSPQNSSRKWRHGRWIANFNKKYFTYLKDNYSELLKLQKAEEPQHFFKKMKTTIINIWTDIRILDSRFGLGENYQDWQQFKVTLINCTDSSLGKLYTWL